jgi:multicomponent Na+:H+ antiporter subunit G
MIADLQNYLVGTLLVFGSLFALAASIGILRLPDVYSRMHAASKAGTLGSGLMLIALAIYAGELAPATRAIAGVVFFMLTAPIAAHVVAKAAYSAGYRLWDGSVHDEMQEEKLKEDPPGLTEATPP